MNIIVINGSPRVNWNTSTLLKKAAQGAASQGIVKKPFAWEQSWHQTNLFES